MRRVPQSRAGEFLITPGKHPTPPYGKYENDGSKDGYRAVCPAPKLDYHQFTVALRFKAEAFGEKNPTSCFGNLKSALFMGGEGYRWFGMSRSKAGHLVITMNNSRHRWEIDEAR